MNRGTFISVHIADLHFAAFTPKEQYELLATQFLPTISSLPKIDMISVNGDIFDHKLMGNSDGIYYASMFIDNLVQLAKARQCTLILLHGTYSHDADQLKLFYHYMEDNTVDVRVITQIQFEQVKNTRILCIPELYGVDETIYQNVLHHSGWYDECIIHGTFEGAVYGNTVGNGRLFTMKDFDMCTGFIIGGHVHKPGCFGGYFYYCGCPYRWRFGEEEEKGYLICAHDLDSGYQHVDFQPIRSSRYVTIDIKDIISNDPQQVIAYIDNLRKEQGIDYLKIKFKHPVEGSTKVILNNYYRNSRTTFVEFMSVMEEQKAMSETNNDIEEEYNFILDDSLSDMEKFVMYVNLKEGTEFITVDRLKEILAEEI